MKSEGQDGGERIRVWLVDDHPMVREGLKALLARYADIEVVGESDRGAGVLEALEGARAGVVLLDLRLPDMSGLELCRRIRERHPGVRVLVLTSYLEEDSVLEAVRAGACGYLLKEIDPDGLHEAILQVHQGGSAMPAEVTQRLVQGLQGGGENAVRQRLSSLSAQERRLMEHVAAGLINKEIAVEMGISEKTVKNYLANLFTKLGVGRRAQVAAIYTAHKGVLEEGKR